MLKCIHFELLLLCIGLLCPRPHSIGALNIDGRYLSVYLLLCPVPDPNSRREGHTKPKIAGKEAHDPI